MERNSSKALRASRIGIFSALYVVTSLIPISIFIGAPSFLALNLIITPIMALLLSPMDAFASSLIGGLISLYLAPAQAMFGAFSILLPVTGATLGSLNFHLGNKGRLVTGAFLISSILAYLIKNYPFPYFILPHAAALCITLLTMYQKMPSFKVKISMYTFVSTICEQGMMMIFAVHLLSLPWEIFPSILPLMLYERIIGTIGASLIIITMTRVAPTLIKIHYKL